MKLQYPFMQLPVSFDAAALAAEIAAIDESQWRPHPQGYPGNDALTLVTTGGDPDSDAVAGPMRATRHLERCPYLQQVLASIGATWGRTRLMRLSGQSEVTPHIDVDYYWRERVRVHVPIVTQPTVRFTCGDAEINMRAGECWLFDTWRLHNVVNDHSLPRIHLVADTVGGKGFWQLVARLAGDLHRARPSRAPVARLRVRERTGGHDALGDAVAYRLRAQRRPATSQYACGPAAIADLLARLAWAMVRLRPEP
jgi:hypothetical protein